MDSVFIKVVTFMDAFANPACVAPPPRWTCSPLLQDARIAKTLLADTTRTKFFVE